MTSIGMTSQRILKVVCSDFLLVQSLYLPIPNFFIIPFAIVKTWFKNSFHCFDKFAFNENYIVLLSSEI